MVSILKNLMQHFLVQRKEQTWVSNPGSAELCVLSLIASLLWSLLALPLLTKKVENSPSSLPKHPLGEEASPLQTWELNSKEIP